MEQHIYANAALVLQTAQKELGADIGYDIAGVKWLNEYINDIYLTTSDELKEKLVSRLGSYLGECIRQNYGGNWVEDSEYGWSVKFSEGNSVFPFTKVEKHLDLGKEESVLSLYTSIPVLFKVADTTQNTSTLKPWWKFW
jgi:hypothetical protein